jgi:hypothetical protein
MPACGARPPKHLVQVVHPYGASVSRDDAPTWQTLLRLALLGATQLIRVTFSPIRLGERESRPWNSGDFDRLLPCLVV